MIQYQLQGFTNGDFSFYGGTVFHKNGRNLLLGENGCVILLSDDLIDQIEKHKPNESLMFKLVQHGLADVPGKMMFKCIKDIEVRYFIIDLTKCCNFDCIYCFRAFKESRHMSFETLNDILNYILKYCNSHGLKQIGLQMWGGEPLLEMDKIRYTAEFFHNSGIRAVIDIETNASLVTDEIAEELYRLGIRIGVSIDGYPDIQNTQRKLASGLASSELVERGIRHLQKYYGKSIGGITVVTKYNYREISKIVDYFIYHLGLTHMKFNLVRDNGNAKEEGLALSSEEVGLFLTEMMESVEAYRALGVDFTEGNLEMKARNLLQRCGISCCISHGCQGGRRMVSFDYKGDIFPCEMIDFPEEKIASIYDGESLDKQIENATLNNSFFISKKADKCKECCWWYFCGGGCSSRNQYLGKIGQVDETECLINGIVYPKLIEWILDGKIS